MKSFHVLVVEDEPAQLRGVLRALEALESTRVTGCSTLAAARKVLLEDEPDLLATDINLAGENGLELLSLLEMQELSIPVIIMTAYRSSYDATIPRSVTVLEKPLSVLELRDLIRKKLEEKTPPPKRLEVTDYLQLAAMGRSSAQVRVHLANGGTADLEIVDGDLWDASMGKISGTAVLRELLKLPADSIVMRPLERTPAERKINTSVEALLLEAARVEDEEDLMDVLVEGGEESQAAAEEEILFSAAFAEGVEASMEKSYEKAIKAFRKALEYQPEDASALYNLQRIEELLSKKK